MATKKAADKEPEEETVTLPAPPEGYTYRLIRGDHCPAQHCPARIDDPLAYAKP